MKMDFKKLGWVALAFVCGFAVHALFFKPVAEKHRARRLLVNLNSTPPVISAPAATNIVAVSWPVMTNHSFMRARKLERFPGRQFDGPSRFDVLPGMRPKLPHAPPGHNLDLF